MHQSMSDSKPQVKSMLAAKRRLSFHQFKLNQTATKSQLAQFPDASLCNKITAHGGVWNASRPTSISRAI